MDLRLSFRERAYLDYLKEEKPDEYRGSWQQVIRHIVDNHMKQDEAKDVHPFKFDPEKAIKSGTHPSDTAD